MGLTGGFMSTSTLSSKLLCLLRENHPSTSGCSGEITAKGPCCVDFKQMSKEEIVFFIWKAYLYKMSSLLSTQTLLATWITRSSFSYLCLLYTKYKQKHKRNTIWVFEDYTRFSHLPSKRKSSTICFYLYLGLIMQPCHKFSNLRSLLLLSEWLKCTGSR